MTASSFSQSQLQSFEVVLEDLVDPRVLGVVGLQGLGLVDLGGQVVVVGHQRRQPCSVSRI